MAVHKQTNPFSIPMIFLSTGWMKRYQGLRSGDQITGGGAFIKEHGFGGEIFNFQPFRGRHLGYVQPSRGGKDKAEPTIHIERLGASRIDQSISGALVIWVAASTQGGSFIVGWYKNAALYRQCQPPPSRAGRRHKGEDCGFYVSALCKDSTLLPEDQRLFQMPRGKGGFGQSNVWYADDPAKHRKLRSDVLRYVGARHLSLPPTGRAGRGGRQSDPLLRQKVEQAAVKVTGSHYERFGYTVDSVEKDNCGWDLTAIHGQRKLKLEVKGLAGDSLQVELTSNEYSMMKHHQDSYRVCVVTGALSSPELFIFSFSKEAGRWEDQDGRRMEVREVVAARCSAGLPESRSSFSSSVRA